MSLVYWQINGEVKLGRPIDLAEAKSIGFEVVEEELGKWVKEVFHFRGKKILREKWIPKAGYCWDEVKVWLLR
jgi:hypothetical protein